MTIRVDSPLTGEPYDVYVPARMGRNFIRGENEYVIGSLSGLRSNELLLYIKIPDEYPTRPSSLETTNWLNKMYTAANSPGAAMYGEPIPFDYPIEAITFNNANVNPPK